MVSTPLPRAYVLLPHGVLLDLADPDPQSWRHEDLARGLARTYRWGGQSKWPRPLSVAQHSLTVLRILMQESDLTPDFALHALLHDAEEGLLAFDCITPLKPILGAPFAALTARLTAAVAARYALPPLGEAERAALKRADRRAAAIEAVAVVGWSPEQVREVLGLEATPSEPHFVVEFWTTVPHDPEVAERAWLGALHHHLAARAGR